MPTQLAGLSVRNGCRFETVERHTLSRATARVPRSRKDPTMANGKCKWCNGTGKHYSVYIKKYVVCDACKGTGKS